MKFRYLGTAAAEGWPAVFCNCDHCHRAKKAGGRNIRTRSQALINDDLLIDFPSDSYHHALHCGLDFSACRYLLVTHSHTDHFSPTDLLMRIKGVFAHDLTEETLTIAASDAVLSVWEHYKAFYNENPGKYVDTYALPLYAPTALGRYTVTALPANHMANEVGHLYIIDDGTAKVLYLHDTGLLFDEVYDYLQKTGLKADLVSFDCTFGQLRSSGGHLGLDSCVVTKERLESIGVIGKDTKLCVNHFSHNSGLIYDELVPVAEELGFLTSYDGMQIDL